MTLFAHFPMSIRHSLRSSQSSGAFIAPSATEKKVPCAIGNRFQICRQQLYVVDKKPLTDLCAPLAMSFQIANSRTRWHCNFKGLSQHRGRAEFSKNVRAPLFNDDLLNEPISARSISLDDSFKKGLDTIRTD